MSKLRARTEQKGQGAPAPDGVGEGRVPEPRCTIALVAIVPVSAFTALASGFAALGFASADQPKRALRWLLFALGSAVVARSAGSSSAPEANDRPTRTEPPAPTERG